MTALEIKKAFVFLASGQWRRVWNEVHIRIYRAAYELIFALTSGLRKGPPPPVRPILNVETKHPIAYESPDHISPSGTKENNNTNKKFVFALNALVARQFPGETKYFLDLGCSGGQLVKDFKDMNWIAVGVEGSDYSLKHRRANWAALAGTHLFTCDITRTYRVTEDNKPARFHLITAWEVLEHIAGRDLDAVFRGIIEHLREGGYFIASTTATPDIVNGVELHQTKMNNAEWRKFIGERYPELAPAELGLKIYQYVRYNFLHPSFLVYRKQTPARRGADSANQTGFASAGSATGQNFR